METESLKVREWLSVPQVAECLGVSVFTVYRLVERKRIPSTRIGRRVLIDRLELDRLLKSGGIPSSTGSGPSPANPNGGGA